MHAHTPRVAWEPTGRIHRKTVLIKRTVHCSTPVMKTMCHQPKLDHYTDFYLMTLRTCSPQEHGNHEPTMNLLMLQSDWTILRFWVITSSLGIPTLEALRASTGFYPMDWNTTGVLITMKIESPITHTVTDRYTMHTTNILRSLIQWQESMQVS